jgi:hypothetical protein
MKILKGDLMKKLLLSTIVSMLITISGAHASEFAVPAWACNLKFKGHAQGLQAILGKFEVKSEGTLNCVSPFQEIRSIPVAIDMSTNALAARIAFGNFDVYGEALQIHLLSNEPEDLLGTYYVAQGQGAIIGGAGALSAVHVNLPKLSMNVSVQFVKGFGLNFGLTKMTITAL